MTKATTEYKADYKESIYYPIWRQVLAFCRMLKDPKPKILEIGCGAGQLAKYLEDEGITDYVGVDNDPDMLKLARSNSNQTILNRDITKRPLYEFTDYNVVIATEVLEHIQDDIGILKLIRPGIRFIFSLPTFLCEGHLRCFTSNAQILNRYFDNLRVTRLIKIGAFWWVGIGVIK